MFPCGRLTAAAACGGLVELLLGQPVAPSGAAEENRRLVAHELAATDSGVIEETARLEESYTPIPLKHSAFCHRAREIAALVIASYANYFRTVDLRFNDANKLPVGGVLADDHNFDFDEFTKTEICQDFWRPARLGRGLAGVILKKEATTSAVSVRREINHRRFAVSDIQNFQQLLPHLRRSLYFQNQLQRASVRVETMSVALDQFPVAVFLLDSHGAVLDHNRAAAELLADPHTPLRIQQQRLIAYRPEDDRKMQEMTRTAVYSLHQVAAAPRFLCLPLRDDLRVLTLLPVPINRSLFAMTSNCVLLFCRKTAASLVDPARLRRQFGFTPAESLVAATIAEGLTLEEFAGRRSISVGTARQQLKSAMVKAEVHTQAQLASTILRSLATLVRGC